MKDFSQPMDVDDSEIVFGARSIDKLMPNEKDIPEEFWHGRGCEEHYFSKLASKWFFEGLTAQPKVKSGLDETKVWRHLSAVMRSWACKHEHKTAAVGYLMSLWLEKNEDDI